MTASASTGVRVQILHVPGCPLLGQARAVVEAALTRSGLGAIVEEVEGSYPSPTVLVNGTDVTGWEQREAASCRLDVPTEEQILNALNDAQKA